MGSQFQCAAGALLFLLVCHRRHVARWTCQCSTRPPLEFSVHGSCGLKVFSRGDEAERKSTVQFAVGLGSHHAANENVDHDSWWLTVASEVRQPGALAPNCSAMSTLRVSARCWKSHSASTSVRWKVGYLDVVPGKVSHTEGGHALGIKACERNVLSGLVSVLLPVMTSPCSDQERWQSGERHSDS